MYVLVTCIYCLYVTNTTGKTYAKINRCCKHQDILDSTLFLVYVKPTVLFCASTQSTSIMGNKLL